MIIIAIISSITFLISCYILYKLFKQEIKTKNQQRLDKRIWQIIGFVFIISFFVASYSISELIQYH